MRELRLRAGTFVEDADRHIEDSVQFEHAGIALVNIHEEEKLLSSLILAVGESAAVDFRLDLAEVESMAVCCNPCWLFVVWYHDSGTLTSSAFRNMYNRAS